MEKFQDKQLHSKSILLTSDNQNFHLEKKAEHFLEESSRNFFDVFGLESHLNFNSASNLSNNFSKNKNELIDNENCYNLSLASKKPKQFKEKPVESQHNSIDDILNFKKNRPGACNTHNCLVMLNKKGLPLLYDGNLDEEPRYVNAKQYNRMMIMRIKKAKEITMKNKQMEVIQQNQTKRKGYKYESRHQHAVKRLRGKDGKFIKIKDHDHENIQKQKKLISKKQHLKEKKKSFQSNSRNQDRQNYQFHEELPLEQHQIFKEENNLILKLGNELNK